MLCIERAVKGWNTPNETSCSNMSGDRSLCVCTGQVTTCSITLRRSQQQIILCVLENFLWKSLSVPQNFVAATSRRKSNQSEFVRLVVATKFFCREKVFTKILQCTRGDLLLRCIATTCCCNSSPSVYL